MLLQTIGPRGWHQGDDVATLAFTPLYDRAAIVKRVVVSNPSAEDTWVLSIQGQECARFWISTVGNQQLLGNTDANFPKVRDLFAFCRDVCGFELDYPVPQGQTLTIASAAGATADVSIEFEEHSPMDVNPGATNGQSASHYIMPVYLFCSTVTHTSGVNEDDFTSQIAALWLPNLFGRVQIPAAYKISVLAYFLEGSGRNPYGSTTDHLSTTHHLGVRYQGQRYYSRDDPGGIPIVGKDAAAGSANTVYGYEHAVYPPFQEITQQDYQLPSPLTLMPGSQAQFLFGTIGDSTGGATYAKAPAVMLLDVQTTGMVPQ